MKKITILIPCHNEEKGIKQVLKAIKNYAPIHTNYSTNVIVVNNKSTDKTAQNAKKLGAKVIEEQQIGKGNAVRAGINHIPPDTDYVVMLDGDGSYKIEEIIRLIEPLETNFCDVITGSRLNGKIQDNSMPLLHRLGNWIFTFLVRTFYVTNTTDALSGYFAWKYKSLLKTAKELKSKNFSIDMEIITKMAKSGYKIYSVPITYSKRIGKSNLKTLQDGLIILKEFLTNLKWKPNE